MSIEETIDFDETMPDGFAREFDLRGLPSRWPEAAMQTTDPRIRIAATPEELHAIGRLRYDLYIARDGKRYDRARHISRTFVEPIDRLSLNFYALSAKGIAGAVRLVRAKDALNDPHLSLLVEAAQPTDLDRTVVNSRFALLPEIRARASIIPMFQAVYANGLIAGATECLIATRHELVPIFEKFGFRTTEDSYRDRVAGASTVLKLDPYDRDYLKSISSPLSDVATDFFSEPNDEKGHIA